MDTTAMPKSKIRSLAPTELINFYKNLSIAAVMTDPTIVDRVFEWLHSHPNITGGYHVKPQLALGFGDTHPVRYFSLLVTIIMARHNQEPWLYHRMTFHALADIQEARGTINMLGEFCNVIDNLQTAMAKG